MKKVFLTGFCRSGTKSVVELCRRLGIVSYHQTVDPPFSNLIPYNFRRPPAWAEEYINKKIVAVNLNSANSDRYFEASWGLAHYIYLLSKHIREAQFLIMIRHPMNACNSLKALRHNQHTENIDELALLYNLTVLSLIWQVEIMQNKPQWMDFDKYIFGEYSNSFLMLFDIPYSRTKQSAIDDHLKKKINSSGFYDLENSKFFNDGIMLVARLKASCNEFH